MTLAPGAIARPATRPPTGCAPTVWPFSTRVGPSGCQLRAPGTKGAGAAVGRTAGAIAGAFLRLYSCRTVRHVAGGSAASVPATLRWRLLRAICTPGGPAGASRRAIRVYAVSSIGSSQPIGPRSSKGLGASLPPTSLTGPVLLIVERLAAGFL